MPHYLISFPAEAMVLSDEELAQAAIDSNAVCQEAMDAGVWVFGGGVDETVPTVLVSGDGSVAEGTHPGSRITGGLTVLDLPDRASAEEWARKIAVACRCAQEIRELM
ncbi:transcription initiation protein [Antiquaquibacter soli]|uniref:Transcription initiation protein n=1 Tax=Antiquaquibacter soli TaxID=3064523 RepID=A0ABT9BNJ7_9MICO|nr:transcription initiation protein [Protaetiibacter sp. WY-16]MDO7882144.1 transcription initiation protein [Protaetiibacter sp. WY-16]